MRELSEFETFEALLGKLNEKPETVQLDGDPARVRPLLARLVEHTKGRGFLAGKAQLRRAEHEDRGSLDVDGLFFSWAQEGSANSKLLEGLDEHRVRKPNVLALMVIDAFDYDGPSHIKDVKNRIRALNNRIELLHLWIVLACDVNSPGDAAASDLSSGLIRIVAE